ncbi:MAG TPA: 4-alpha-glucanotransferase [Anaerolineaceae bacterium]
MNYKRASGIILHPTSLPGPDGIGDLGPEAYRWINFLEESGCGLWQVLPLGPTGYGDSPYQCFSAFAGNPYLVSPALLLEDGLLTRADLADRPQFPAEQVNYGEVIGWKLTLLDRAFAAFKSERQSWLVQEFAAFQEKNAHWLEDYSLFMAIKEANGGVSWDNWDAGLRTRLPNVLQEFRESHLEQIEQISFRQFLFFRQWNALHKYATEKGIQIIGDIPIFIAFDSADAWSHKELFYMTAEGQPEAVAGVPPDYFSPTGQLWGNPLYRWSVHKQTGYSWWLQRMQATLSMVDIIRLDHFRGFAGYWEVPFGNETAEFGRWVRGPGVDFFKALQEGLGDLPILAEDLGEISQDVFDLRDTFGLPGMKIFQFAFLNDPTDPFLPHNFPSNCVAYTGTHDNDTTRGWYESAPERERDFFRRYLARSGDSVAWDTIRAVWSSVAVFALAPMQDFLDLGTQARMNYPGRASGNWMWRMLPNALDAALTGRIYEQNYLYNRVAGTEKLPPPRQHIPYAEAD